MSALRRLVNGIDAFSRGTGRVIVVAGKRSNLRIFSGGQRLCLS